VATSVISNISVRVSAGSPPNQACRHLQLVGSEDSRRPPAQLSAVIDQRVSIAVARLVVKPRRLLLLDLPFGPSTTYNVNASPIESCVSGPRSPANDADVTHGIAEPCFLSFGRRRRPVSPRRSRVAKWCAIDLPTSAHPRHHAHAAFFSTVSRLSYRVVVRRSDRHTGIADGSSALVLRFFVGIVACFLLVAPRARERQVGTIPRAGLRDLPIVPRCNHPVLDELRGHVDRRSAGLPLVQLLGDPPSRSSLCLILPFESLATQPGDLD